jgi:LCP family protein required for cell wall assembly
VPETGYRGGVDRLNASFAYGAGEQQDRAQGGRVLAGTLKQLTGLPGFTAAALIDFYGFTSVVQTLGEIELCVDTDTESIFTGVVYRQGCQRMDAISALDYVRQRKMIAGGDFARQRHQQQFIKSIVQEVRRQGILTDPARLDAMVRAAAGAMTVTTGPFRSVDLLLALRGVSPERITLMRVPADGVYTDVGEYLGERLLPDADELFAALRADRLDAFLSAHPDFVNAES